MACAFSASTVSTAAALVASPKPAGAPQCLSFPRAAARPSRLAAAGSMSARARCFVARAAAEVCCALIRYLFLPWYVCEWNFHVCMRLCPQYDLPLVGNKAPDFEAEAVFDQEFIHVSP